MAHARRVSALGAVACALPAAALAAPADASAGSDRLTDAVNDYRSARGLPRLRVSTTLRRAAARQASHVLRANRMHHHRMSRRRYRTVGENLAWDPGAPASPRAIVEMWAASTAHRRVLTLRRVRWIGAARRHGGLGARMGSVWVLRVGGR